MELLKIVESRNKKKFSSQKFKIFKLFKVTIDEKLL